MYLPPGRFLLGTSSNSSNTTSKEQHQQSRKYSLPVPLIRKLLVLSYHILILSYTKFEHPPTTGMLVAFRFDGKGCD
ncbi:hypothetical protein M0802_010871 [Mischocyttarus mexicanus]|nr:hypothetical protein M0802_010871 [Mischocyttarus mexicanus]